MINQQNSQNNQSESAINSHVVAVLRKDLHDALISGYKLCQERLTLLLAHYRRHVLSPTRSEDERDVAYNFIYRSVTSIDTYMASLELSYKKNRAYASRRTRYYRTEARWARAFFAMTAADSGRRLTIELDNRAEFYRTYTSATCPAGMVRSYTWSPGHMPVPATELAESIYREGGSIVFKIHKQERGSN